MVRDIAPYDLTMRWSACFDGGRVAATSVHAPCARTDEGGVSFWAPGKMGSFSAVLSDPGFVVPVVYLHASAGSEAPAIPTGGVTRGQRGL